MHVLKNVFFLIPLKNRQPRFDAMQQTCRFTFGKFYEGLWLILGVLGQGNAGQQQEHFVLQMSPCLIIWHESSSPIRPSTDAVFSLLELLMIILPNLACSQIIFYPMLPAIITDHSSLIGHCRPGNFKEKHSMGKSLYRSHFMQDKVTFLVIFKHCDRKIVRKRRHAKGPENGFSMYSIRLWSKRSADNRVQKWSS